MSDARSLWRQAKGWPGWLLLAVLVATLLAVGISREAGPATSEERVEAITKRIACPICDGETVFDSRNATSAKIRTAVQAQVNAGVLDDDEIVTGIEQAYGGRVLLVPRASGIDALVWVLPTAAFVCAVAGLGFAFRRWRRAADTVPTDDDRELVAAALASAASPPDGDEP